MPELLKTTPAQHCLQASMARSTRKSRVVSKPRASAVPASMARRSVSKASIVAGGLDDNLHVGEEDNGQGTAIEAQGDLTTTTAGKEQDPVLTSPSLL